ncbi:MlaE family lipid ABC transporter permease subunit [Ferrigenium sp. UT4]
MPEIYQLERQLETIRWPSSGDLEFDGSAVSKLDTAGALLLQRTLNSQQQSGRSVRIVGLRPESNRLLQLIAAHTIPLTPALPERTRLLAGIGKQFWHSLNDAVGMLSFIGECVIGGLTSLFQPRRIRWRSFLHNVQVAGFEAMPIVGLLAFLMGIVIAYQGADQLQRFGANIFIADLVGLSMLRELAPLLTAIIVAGRSGSAYAAQIGTMKMTEEIDALRTIGIVPAEILVLPKLMALIITLPMLTLWADVSGMFGGMLMARAQLDVSFTVFLDRLEDAVSVSSFLTGIGKAPVFAFIIALVGCYRGFQVSGSAASVGQQTTVSVVQSIFLVILADALFSVVFNWFEI